MNITPLVFASSFATSKLFDISKSSSAFVLEFEIYYE